MPNSYLQKAVHSMHECFMRRRFQLFLDVIDIRKGDLIVDLGGGNGEFFELFQKNRDDYEILVADISEEALDEAHKKGFMTVLLRESEQLPFRDGEIDVVFCNSVIEHCTVPKSAIWTMTDDDEFRAAATIAQTRFAKEIERVGRRYFVQTPSASFPIESHTLFPLTGKLSRPHQIAMIRWLNRFWFKKTSPAWHLLSPEDMQGLFESGTVQETRWLGFSKEIIAFRN